MATIATSRQHPLVQGRQPEDALSLFAISQNPYFITLSLLKNWFPVSFIVIKLGKCRHLTQEFVESPRNVCQNLIRTDGHRMRRSAFTAFTSQFPQWVAHSW